MSYNYLRDKYMSGSSPNGVPKKQVDIYLSHPTELRTRVTVDMISQPPEYREEWSEEDELEFHKQCIHELIRECRRIHANLMNGKIKRTK